ASLVLTPHERRQGEQESPEHHGDDQALTPHRSLQDRTSRWDIYGMIPSVRSTNAIDSFTPKRHGGGHEGTGRDPGTGAHARRQRPAGPRAGRRQEVRRRLLSPVRGD